MKKFSLHQPFPPAGDQINAIASLTNGLNKGYRNQTLLGVTGSGKTFTMANVIQNVQKPTLVIAHNKTLAAQLASEFRQFFPDNAVHYFVSYYDYYQPEAYIPTTDTYIEKDSSINDEIDRLRNAATQALMTRSDVIIVASVSCIYGLGSPDIYRNAAILIETGQATNRQTLIHRLCDVLYERNDMELSRGKFRVKGDCIELYPSYDEQTYRITFLGETIEAIEAIDPISGKVHTKLETFEIFPARHFLTENSVEDVLQQMEADLAKEVATFKKAGRLLEAQRLQERTTFDIEMIRQTGICSGIENYSRYFDRRDIGTPPSVLLDYFPADFLMIIDESHITLPQIRGMYAGDKARKDTLIHYGFRLQAARDNRPLTFEEFSTRVNQVIYTSATPSDYEKEVSTLKNRVNKQPHLTPDGVVEQIIRPTGLVDPAIIVRPSNHQVDDLMAEIKDRNAVGQRVLVTTLTKRMAEDLTEYLKEAGIKVQYLHSEVATLERTEILRDLRNGIYDVIVGINLLREGLDLPEVSLVAILDADREGFLRNATSLIQTFGRAARHVNGTVILYADKETDSIKTAISETNRRRDIQLAYNKKHNITPLSISKSVEQAPVEYERGTTKNNLPLADIPPDERRRLITLYKKQMEAAVKNLEFEKAAELRDKIKLLEEL